MILSTRRFSNRVDNYVKYRPSYPDEVVDTLCTVAGLAAGDPVADVGAGTGIFTGLLLSHGLHVYAVEPNAKMRSASEVLHGGTTAFVSVDGTAECTNLPAHSVDLITAAQAFHWFDRDATRAEFARLLRPGGRLALIWNERSTASAFQNDYEKLLLDHAPDYRVSSHRNLDESITAAYFDDTTYRRFSFDNRQHFDMCGLEGRLQSSSYSPLPDSPAYPALLSRMHEIFARHAIDGRVEFEYETIVHVGSL